MNRHLLTLMTVFDKSNLWKVTTNNKKRYGTLSAQILQELESVVGSRGVFTTAAKRSQHDHDESYHSGMPPAVVVYPENTKQVSKIVKTCSINKIPIVPYGTGTGLEGGACSFYPNSVCVNLSEMRQISPPNLDDFDVTVEAGVTRLELNRSLRSSGMYFPIDPGADASLCGMCATGASGTMAVKYGTMRHNVLNLQVVLPNGDVIDTAGPGKRAKKSSAGYNLTSLFIGSEGTLGIITKATLVLHPIPNNVACSIARFSNVSSAVQTVIDIKKIGVSVARAEFLDDVAIRASNSYSNLNQKEMTTLMFEVHTLSEANAKEQISLINETCESHGATDIYNATDVDERNKLWKARHDALYCAMSLRPNSKCLITDVCVPLSNLPGVIDDAKRWLPEHGLVGTIIGHVGDGNFHVCIPIVDVTRELTNVKNYANRLSLRAIEANGTCTGEHGIGLGKRKLLTEEIGQVGVEVLKTLKMSIDPNCVMNPEKVVSFA